MFNVNVHKRNICKTKSGRTKCGAGCTRVIQALEGLQRIEERKREKKKEKELAEAKLMQNTRKPGSEESESESFEEYSYSDEETEKKEVPKQSRSYAKRGDFRRSEAKQDGGGGMGMGDWVGGRVRGALLVPRQAEFAEFHAQRQRVIEERAEMLAGMAWLRDIPG